MHTTEYLQTTLVSSAAARELAHCFRGGTTLDTPPKTLGVGTAREIGKEQQGVLSSTCLPISCEVRKVAGGRSRQEGTKPYGMEGYESGHRKRLDETHSLTIQYWPSMRPGTS